MLSLVLSGAAVAALAPAPAAATEWRLVDGPLMTRWSRDWASGKEERLHPRPHLERGNWMSLCGVWDYAIRSRNDGPPDEWDGKIRVPFAVESALSGVRKRVGANDRLWYRHSFPMPSWPPPRWLLHFEAVDWEARVWVNGKEAGTHRGGYDPFTLDITDLVTKPGERQEIVVSVWDPTDQGYQPRGKQVENPNGIWYTPSTGIWQAVWLEGVEDAYIGDLRVIPDVDRGEVSVTVNVKGKREKGLKAWVSAYREREAVGTVSGEPGRPLVLKIPDARLWSPEEPFLYRMNVILTTDQKRLDAVRSYFAMRKISIGKDRNGVNRLMLNNRPVFHFGLLDQGFWPDGLYTAPSDDALRHDIDMTKTLGYNMIRKHVKVEPSRWYFWCDWLGIMVWQDMPSAGVKPDGEGSAEAKANFKRELKAMMDSRHHHPCIVMWVPFNEGWGQHDTEEIVRWVKEYDPTRLVNCASGWTDVPGLGDVRDVHHYPGPGTADLEDNRAVVLGEFGGLGLPVKGHTWQDEKNWGYRSFPDGKSLTKAYLKLIEDLEGLIRNGLSAAVYTQTTDVEIEVNGIMTYDRQEVKIASEKVVKANRAISSSLSKKP